MNVYIETPVPGDIMDIIATSGLQIGGVTFNNDVILDGLKAMVMQGSMAVIKSGPVVVLMRAFTPDVGIVHACFVPGAKPHAILRGAKEFMVWAAENTHYHKLEARTPNLRLAILMEHCGAEVEGIRRESARTGEAMADEYELGYILRKQPH